MSKVNDWPGRVAENRQFLTAAAFSLLLPSAVQAAPLHFLCPQSISQDAVHLTAPGQEWTPFVSSPLYLNAAAPADGPPARRGALRPGAAAKTRTGWTQKYALDGLYPEGKWLRCDYGGFAEI